MSRKQVRSRGRTYKTNSANNERRDERTDSEKRAESSRNTGKRSDVETKDTEEPKGSHRYEKQPGDSLTKQALGAIGNALQKNDGGNDPAWYSADPQLMIDAANFPYAYPLGDKLQLSGSHRDVPYVPGSNKAGNATKYHEGIDGANAKPLPGVCTLYLVPTIGYSFDKNDAANVSANAFYTHLRYANSGRKNYDPADLMMYGLAMSDIISFIQWASRLYKYAFMYSQRNKYIAEALIKAQGFDPENLKLNLANMRYWINAFINKVASFAVPSSIRLFYRRAFLYSNFYIENSDGNIKDQLYQFAPDSFTYFMLDNDGAGMLRHITVNTSGDLMDWDRIVTIGETLISNIQGDEDWGLISGDVLKAYGAENIIAYAPLDAAPDIYPVFDEYVLSQFRNATIVYNLNEAITSTNAYVLDATKGVNAGDIWQDSNGNVRCENVVGKSWNDALAASFSKLITTRNPTPTPADSMEASRLMVSFKGYVNTEDGDGKVVSLYSGTEICTRCLISRMDYNTRGMVKDINHSVATPKMDDINSVKEWLNDLEVMALFHWAPTLYRAAYYITGSGDTLTAEVSSINVVSNIDNYTVVGELELAKMHQAALLSLFYVPGVAKIIGMGN